MAHMVSNAKIVSLRWRGGQCVGVVEGEYDPKIFPIIAHVVCSILAVLTTNAMSDNFSFDACNNLNKKWSSL